MKKVIIITGCVCVVLLVLCLKNRAQYYGYSIAQETNIKLLQNREVISNAYQLKELIASSLDPKGKPVRINNLHNAVNIEDNHRLQIWMREFDVMDGWGNPFWIKIENINGHGNLTIWSSGENQINENGDGDDITVNIKMNQRANQ